MREILDRILVLGYIPREIDVVQLVSYANNEGLLDSPICKKLAYILYRHMYKDEGGAGVSSNDVEFVDDYYKSGGNSRDILLRIGTHYIPVVRR